MVCATAAGVQLHHRNSIRRELLVAQASVFTVVDYGLTDALGEADLAARARLDVLQAEDLNAQEVNAVAALRAYLAAVESVESSHSIETTRLRIPIADKALNDVGEAMKPFVK
jgi:hypothetical protein